METELCKRKQCWTLKFIDWLQKQYARFCVKTDVLVHVWRHRSLICSSDQCGGSTSILGPRACCFSTTCTGPIPAAINPQPSRSADLSSNTRNIGLWAEHTLAHRNACQTLGRWASIAVLRSSQVDWCRKLHCLLQTTSPVGHTNEFWSWK